MLLLLACPSTLLEPTAEPRMEAVDLLIRASLDLRAVRPSVEDLETVEADPDAVEDLIEGYLYDDRFGGRVRDLWAETFLTRIEGFNVSPEAYGLSDYAAYESAIGEESLYVLSEVAQQDLPWTNIVTADWTMANETLAAIWPVDYPEGAAGWQRVQYTDGRPMSGVLSANSLWWRYPTTEGNLNRKRANAIARIFTCNDYFKLPLDLDRNINILDIEDVADAIATNPGCQACHVSMDPLASYLFGFFTYNPYSATEATTYHPERELLWKETTGAAPGYYGEIGYTLNDLGHQLAGDHRFIECAVETTYQALLRREATLSDTDALIEHREAFLRSDLSYRALVLSITQDPRYRAGATDTAGYVPLKMATPDLLASQVEDLTGFRWTYGGFDMMSTDRYGYRVLAGGVDGDSVTKVGTSPNTTIVLVQERLAENAASFAAQRDDASDSPVLFDLVDFSETPDTDRPAMEAQIQALHFRIFGHRVAADGPEVEANLQLWADLFAIQADPVEAWAGVLTVLLRDPDFLFY